MIEYFINPTIAVEDLIALYRDSTLGERRPIHDVDRMQSMLNNANLVVAAYDQSLLVGVARSLTDFSYVAYVSDLAVRKAYQRQGIGKLLLSKTQQALHPQASLVLLSAPMAVDYYPHIGFKHHPHAFQLPSGTKLS